MAQSKLLCVAGTPTCFVGAHICLENTASFKQALRTSFENAERGYSLFFSLIREAQVATEEELRAALGKTAGKASKDVRDRWPPHTLAPKGRCESREVDTPGC